MKLQTCRQFHQRFTRAKFCRQKITKPNVTTYRNFLLYEKRACKMLMKLQTWCWSWFGWELQCFSNLHRWRASSEATLPWKNRKVKCQISMNNYQLQCFSTFWDLMQPYSMKFWQHPNWPSTDYLRHPCAVNINKNIVKPIFRTGMHNIRPAGQMWPTKAFHLAHKTPNLV